MAFTYKLLEVKNLNTSFRIDAGKVLAVNGVSFELEKGKVLGIVGESGSGKSVTAYSIMGILDKNGSVDSGKIIYNGTDLLKISERQMRNIRGNRISIIFQDAMTSLNPTWSIGNQLREAILTHAKNPIEQAVYDLENSIESDQQRIASMKRGLQNHPERDQLRADLAFVENKLIEDRKRLVEEREKATIAYVKLKKEKNEEYRQGKGAYNVKIALARKEYWKHYFDLAPLPSIEEAYEQQGIRLQKLRAYSKQRYVDYQQERIALLREEFAKKENPTREEFSLQRRSIKNEKAILGTAKAEHKEAEKELRKLIKEYRNGVRLAPRHARKAALKKEKVAKLDFKYDCISAYKETKYSANKKALQMLTEVGITEPEKRMKQYPFELSGGMLQRCMIAMALVERPDILIADEPTTALDVTIQAQILDLLKKLQKEYGMAILIITHDLGVVAQVCDEVDIMYAGRIVERGSVEEIFYNPQHEYTKGLLKSMPKLDSDGSKLEPIQGNPVDLFCLPKGCAFSSRCKECMEICIEKYPEEVHCGDSGHAASCWKMVQRLHEEGLIDVINGKPEGKPLIYNGAVIKQGKGVKK